MIQQMSCSMLYNFFESTLFLGFAIITAANDSKISTTVCFKIQNDILNSLHLLCLIIRNHKTRTFFKIHYQFHSI